MRNHRWKAVSIAAILCCGMAPISSVAQQAAKAATGLETAKVEFPAVAGSESSSGTEAGSAASPATATAAATTAAPAAPAGAAVANPATTTTAPASVAVPINRDLVIKELSEMKARIAELEAELKARSGAEDAADADKDANALRTAEGDTTGSLAGGQAGSLRLPRLLLRRLRRSLLKPPPGKPRSPATGRGLTAADITSTARCRPSTSPRKSASMQTTSSTTTTPRTTPWAARRRCSVPMNGNWSR